MKATVLKISIGFINSIGMLDKVLTIFSNETVEKFSGKMCILNYKFRDRRNKIGRSLIVGGSKEQSSNTGSGDCIGMYVLYWFSARISFLVGK